jgi:transcriptional regulator with XRE-family HTH domain
MSSAPDNASGRPDSLSAEHAEAILKANYRNLVKKVQAGRTLSAGEVNLLQAIQAGGRAESKNFAKTQAELAETLGVSRKTIQRAMKLEGRPTPRPDGRLEVAAWRSFLQGTGAIEDDNLSATELKARHLLLQNQKLELSLAVMRRDYLPATDVERWGAEIGAAVRKVVGQIHLAAPSVVGVSVPEAEARLKEIEDEILEQLHTLPERLERARNEPAA